MDAETIASTIKKHRKIANLSQIELANLAGIGKTTLFEIEKNNDNVSWHNIKAVLTVLNIKFYLESPLK
jgi:HTH-type transcriptional regulator / antitoxin HipB